MKAPGWGKAVGIIMIILGSFGIFYNAYKLIIPKLFEMQSKMMSGISKSVEWDEIEHSGPTLHPDEFVNVFEEQFALSDTTTTWLPVLAGIGILFCIFYILGGVFLLKPKPLNYKLAIASLGAMIFLNIVSYFILFPNDSSIILIGLMIYSFIGVAIDITLLIIALSSNKSAYYGIKEKPLSSFDTLDA